jgi:hypothetical protein
MLSILTLSLATYMGQPLLPLSAELHPLLPSPQLAIFERFRRNKEDEERQRTQVVTVTTAQLTSENISGSWYHTLKGLVENRTPKPVQTIVVHYEVVAAGTGKLLDAGSLEVPTPLLQPGGQTEFVSSSPKAGGQIRITMVEWLNDDRTYGKFPQRQLFAN